MVPMMPYVPGRKARRFAPCVHMYHYEHVQNDKPADPHPSPVPNMPFSIAVPSRFDRGSIAVTQEIGGLLAVGTVLCLERDEWSMIKLLTQTSKYEYPLPLVQYVVSSAHMACMYVLLNCKGTKGGISPLVPLIRQWP